MCDDYTILLIKSVFHVLFSQVTQLEKWLMWKLKSQWQRDKFNNEVKLKTQTQTQIVFAEELVCFV